MVSCWKGQIEALGPRLGLAKGYNPLQPGNVKSSSREEITQLAACLFALKPEKKGEPYPKPKNYPNYMSRSSILGLQTQARYRGGAASRLRASVRAVRFILEAPYPGGLTGARPHLGCSAFQAQDSQRLWECETVSVQFCGAAVLQDCGAFELHS